ncbi:MAG: hypothetical protein R8M45_02960 [Ghiorsea sp.]
MICIPKAHAFYANDDVSMLGALYIDAGQLENEPLMLLSSRLMLDYASHQLHSELHLVAQQATSAAYKKNTQFDRLNLSYSNDILRIKVGRQPINLATTFFFSPNDFFAPFAALSTNRDYKKGVDAIVIDYEITDLSQLSLAYVQHPQNNAHPSITIAYNSAFEDLQIMVLVAEINDNSQFPQRIIGASLQTSLFDSLGIRAEGNIQRQGNKYREAWVIGIDYRWQNELNLSLEWFYNDQASPTTQLPYTGNAYLGLSLTYPFTPLLQASLSSVANSQDGSWLQTTQLNYSLSDESLLQAYWLQPMGTKTSEFGNAPTSMVIAYQLYF